MNGTVFIVMRDDGNVCCPATELDSVWSTKERADRRASIVKSSGTGAHVMEIVVDMEPTGL